MEELMTGENMMVLMMEINVVVSKVQALAGVDTLLLTLVQSPSKGEVSRTVLNGVASLGRVCEI
jgi:hypothetical protein